MQLGQYIQDRRNNMGMSLSALSRELGGSPGASFISKIENGLADISSSVAVRMADALAMPRPVMLNATGYATPEQQDEAMAQLADLVGSPAPQMVSLPVIDPEHPDETLNLRYRQRLLRRKEDVFLIDLDGSDNEPYVGEVMATRERKPKEGTPVIAVVNNVAGAWEWHTSRPTGDFLSRPHDKAAKFRVLGVILRVVSELNLDNE